MYFCVKDLSFSTGGKAILKHISLSFAEGRFTAIVGPNGSGKSTLLSFLGRARYTRGCVFLRGEDIADIPLAQYARHVAMLTQERAAVPDFSVAHAVLMGRYPHKKKYADYTEEDVRIAKESMDEVGILPLRDRSLCSLSGGEFQRVRIARMLAQRTEIMLLDEPTNHLDVKHKVFLLRRLKELQRTSVCVLHDLSLAARFADDIVVMKDGRCMAFGETARIMHAALLEDVFEVPFIRFEKDGTVYWNY